MNRRDTTRKLKIGQVHIGGGEPIAIQSMTNTKTENVEATVKQILELEKAGCHIVRVAVPTMEAAQGISKIKSQINIPLVGDIHFDYRLALECIQQGIDKIRINPGNIGDETRIQKVVKACKENHIPIRIGVNSGSLEKHILEKYKHPTAEALVESGLYHIRILEALDFYDIAVSIKSSNVLTGIKAYNLMAEKVNYPLHLGVTEAGTRENGTIKSSVGLGAMLAQGLGDTLRVSLTSNPVDEVHVAKKILQNLDLYPKKIEFISCPTCGRTSIDLISIAKDVEQRLEDLDISIKVAVMGCVVNGPGEAKEADIGIAGGRGEGLIFKKGQIIAKVPEAQLVDALVEEIHKIQNET